MRANRVRRNLDVRVLFTLSLVLIIFLTMAPFSHANADYQFEPAALIDGGQEYLSRVEFPSFDGDVSMVVRCFAHAHRDGFAGDAECFGSLVDGSDAEFVKSVLRATRNFKIRPATRNGENVSVWFNFAFQFVQKDGQQSVKIYPNHLRYGMFYGGQYTSPQRIEMHTAERLIKSAVRVDVETADFDLANPLVSQRAIKQKCGIIKFLRTETLVSTGGIPLEAVVASKEEDGHCEELAPNRPLRGEYIPAHYEGQPFAAFFAESFGRSAYSGKLGKCHDHELAHGYRILQDSGGACDQ